jgi:hypothetical protein
VTHTHTHAHTNTHVLGPVLVVDKEGRISRIRISSSAINKVDLLCQDSNWVPTNIEKRKVPVGNTRDKK